MKWEVTGMKKLAKLTALLLAGVMMLSMTACCGTSSAFNEETARKMILDEINAYRKELGENPVDEYKELDDYASAFMKPFEEMNTIVLLESGTTYFEEYDALYDELRAKWPKFSNKEHFGATPCKRADNECEERLVAEYVSREVLKAQIRLGDALAAQWVDGIGIGFAKVNGKVYWYCEPCGLY